jgi:Icc protein
MSTVRITHFTDPHLYSGEHESLRGVATLPALTAALAHARAHDWPPDAVLVTGDLVQDDPGGYAHFRRLFGALGMPVLCVPGNHDEPQAMRRELSGQPFVLDGFVDLGRLRIVLLDSCIPGSASGALAHRSSRSWERAATAGTRATPVCLHHHPCPCQARPARGYQRDQFLHTIDAHRNVRAVVGAMCIRTTTYCETCGCWRLPHLCAVRQIPVSRSTAGPGLSHLRAARRARC